MIPRLLRTILSIISGSALAAGLFAQAPAPKLAFPDASPAGSVKQRVGLTDIEISYNRPSMKGRAVFGHLVPYGSIWRTGANTATKITFSTDVKLNGTAVPAGTYELFTIPGETEWTVIIHKNMSQWGSYAYDMKNDVARISAKPSALGFPVETLSIYLDNLRAESATLNILWEKTIVPVAVTVDVKSTLVPQIEAAMAAPEGKKPYFPAAMFYYENNLDLKKAVAWMDAGIAEKPDAYWMIYRKGLVLAKMGDKAGAIAAAEQSLALAEKQTGELREEYVRLNKALIDSQR
ncbi:MAG: DUF2911 domain-containing protein [Opitutae bacterium]|nr:DUF2911 domain-containing protein [Opitutae bacterium]